MDLTRNLSHPSEVFTSPRNTPPDVLFPPGRHVEPEPMPCGQTCGTCPLTSLCHTDDVDAPDVDPAERAFWAFEQDGDPDAAYELARDIALNPDIL